MIFIVAGLALWLAFRWAVPTVRWIERRFWDARAASPSEVWSRRGR
jgi:hypothetical protein